MPDILIQKISRRYQLSKFEISAFNELCSKVHTVRPRTTFISEGDQLPHIHVIRSGFACRYKTLPDGGRAILALLIPGDICDLDALILGSMDHSIRSLNACEMIQISRAALVELTDRLRELDRALRWTNLSDEAILREWLISAHHRSAEMKVAHLFCELHFRLEQIGLTKNNSYIFPLAQADLGDMMGISNVHINRVLQKLRAEQLVIFKEKRVIILNLEGLKTLARFNAKYLLYATR